MPTMIEAVAVDLGGVLFSEGKSVALEKLSRAYGYDRDLVAAVLSSPKSMELRKGLVSDTEFWNWAQQQLPAQYDSRLIKREWYDGYILDQAVHDLIAELRKKYLMIAFSGNIKSRVDYLEKKYRFRHLFDLEIYSFDCNLTKPDRGFVEVMIAKSGVRAHKIVYLDDNDSYAQPARQLGVKVVIYRRGEMSRVLQELRRYGVEL